ncbi:MAG: SGNH/GDSL hydrolase family protein [Acidobacteria bacterium]|nr:SGNH/GDSL hydrolase family protein [Acidobacteriota bacterium]
MPTLLTVRSIVVTLLAALFLWPTGAQAQSQPRWLAAWTVSQNTRQEMPQLSNSSVRMFVRPAVSGSAVRVRLENTLGQAPVTFSAGFVGMAGDGAAVVPGSNRRLTFGGRNELTLAPGAGAWSDPVTFDVKPFQRLAVSLDVASASDISAHTLGLVTNYYAPGSHAADVSGAGFVPVPVGGNVPGYPFYWVAKVDVLSSAAAGVVVAFGDSITDGRCSTNEGDTVIPDRYQRWTDVLALRLAALPPGEVKAVVNEGIAGNRINQPGGQGPSGLSRLDRDALERAGATHVIFFEGTNDIAGGATAEQVIASMQQVIDRVRARGLGIIGVTIIPRGRPESMMGWNAQMEQHRLAVNAWIRTQAKFDAVIDFDPLMKGGPVYAGSESIKPEFNCGDYTHPNPAGYKAMGEAIDLRLLSGGRTGATR